MSITITYAWWWIPAAVTALGLLYALSRPDNGGYLSGLDSIFVLVPVLAVSAIAWAVAGAFK